MQKNHIKLTNTPPNLLKGILVSVITITLTILISTWLFIDYQVESLVIKRTSEYAHSIARIAADSSAEALLSDDKLQLNLLTENVAKDPYIRQATIYSEDGQIASQHPEDNKPLTIKNNQTSELNLQQINNPPMNNKAKSQLDKNKLIKQQFIQQQKNIPFIETISYQGITAGWFKLEVERYLLEKEFRASFQSIQLISAIIASSLFILLIFLLYRFDLGVRQVVNSCQHLLIKNKIKPPKKKALWLNAIRKLSESQQLLPQDNQQKQQLTHPNWINSRKIEQAIICYIEFNVPIQSHLTSELNYAQSYLEQAIRAFGGQSQGSVLNGCLVTFLSDTLVENANHLNSLSKAVSFIALIQKLFNSLSMDIKLKTCLSRASVLLLESEHQFVTGVTLLGDIKSKINKLLLNTRYNTIVSFAINSQQLEQFTSIKPMLMKENQESHCYTICQINGSIEQQITRKFNFIVRS